MHDRRQTRTLILLNAGLLLLLGVVTLAPQAQAQRGRQARRAPGDYTMVAARPINISEDAIFIVDANNMELLTVRYDRSDAKLKFIDFRDLAADLDNAEQNERR